MGKILKKIGDCLKNVTCFGTEISPHVRQSGFRDTGIYSVFFPIEIRNPGNICLRKPEYSSKNPGSR